MTTELQLFKLSHPTASHWAAGQPTPEQLPQIKAAGITHIVNLRPAAEDLNFDEASAAATLGLNYHPLPISGPADLTLAKAQALDTVLAAVGDAPTLIHCASSNRVGALMSLRAAWLHGQSADEALAIGRAYGLTAMEPLVQKLLSEAPR